MKPKVCFLLLCNALAALILSGCTKDTGIEPSKPDVSLMGYEKINKFIIDGIQTYYLWESQTNWKQYDYREIYTFYGAEHDKLFNQLIYRNDDKWSTLTDDIHTLGNEFAGISTTFGYTLQFYYNGFASNKREVIAVVLFTSENSPASRAGLKRGDVIIEMNDAKITVNNYMDLYYAPSLRLRCGIVKMDARKIVPLQETIDLAAVQMYENPVQAVKTIDKEGHKIGYLCYTGYQMESEKELIRLFSDFKSEGVQDVVLDLRYNPGGYARTALLLSSILAPEDAVKSKRIYLEHHYNSLLENAYKKQGQALSESFVDTLPVNMNLKRLYVLTSWHTASASEATIVGLAPYLDIIQIGDTTSGKYCGGFLLSPEDLYDERMYYRDFSNWGMYIMIYRFANIKGINSFTGGLVPTILAEEDTFELKPFGDETDPLLGRAIAHITGKEYVELRSKAFLFPGTTLPDKRRPVDGRMIHERMPMIMEEELKLSGNPIQMMEE